MPQTGTPALLVLALLALTLSAPRASADDGSWVTRRGYVPSEGALYSETGNPDIVMEKEYLELRDVGLGATRAVFQFHNTSSAAVTVECAFPILVDFDVRAIKLDGDGSSFSAWDFGDVMPGGHAPGQTSSPEDDGFVKALLAALSVNTVPWNADADTAYAGTYFRDDQYPRGRKEMDPAKLMKLFSFHVMQGGRELSAESCVVDFGTAPGHLALHFRHALSFDAGGTSVVTVTYAMPTRSAISAEPLRSPGISREFTWKYVLETAASWKDNVDRIVLAVPPGLHPDLEAPWRSVGTIKGLLLYTVQDWKPTANDNLSLEWRDTQADYPEFWRQVTEPLDPQDLATADSPAVLLGASSFLPEKSDVFLPRGIWRNAPFDAARLFDGLPETAWAVRTPRGGIGEYVRFSLDSEVQRIEIANGYQRSAVDFPDKDTWSYFGKNNRVKTLDILGDDGSFVQRLQLADTRELQRFNVSLPAGTYRAAIVDIYRGSRWNDTCLGELGFVRGTAEGFGALSQDPFFGPFLK
jgi:hypothetical protein